MKIYTFEVTLREKGSDELITELYNVTAKYLIGAIIHGLVMDGDIVKSFRLVNEQ